MTTDITELAQREQLKEKFEAWLSEKTLYARYMHWCDSLNAYDYTGIQLAWEAYQAGGVELVEALEKAQAKNALVAGGIEASTKLHERIAELESRTVTVKLPEPHAHLIWIQAGHAPDDHWDDVAVSHSEKDRCCDGSERYPVYARWEIEEMLAAAGIKVEAE